MTNSIKITQSQIKVKVVPNTGEVLVSMNGGITYTNTSSRFTLPDLNGLVGSSEFTSGNIANIEEYDVIDSYIYQVEKSVTNYVKYSKWIEEGEGYWTLSNVVSTPTHVSPDNQNTGYHITTTIDSGNHYIGQEDATYPSVDNTYVASVFINYNEGDTYKYFQLVADSYAGSEGNKVIYDLKNKCVVSMSGGATNAKIIKVASGFYWCWFSVSRSSKTGLQFKLQILDNSLNESFIGDTSGFIFWIPQFTEGNLPSSIIKTEATKITRNSDVAWLGTASIPDSLVTGNFLLVVEFPFDSTIMNGTTWSSCILGYGVSGENSLNYCPDTRKFVVRQGSTTKVESDAVTFDRMRPILLNINCVDGTLAIEGCKSGNAIYTGTAWTWTKANNLYFCQDSGASNFFNGFISDIYAKGYSEESSFITGKETVVSIPIDYDTLLTFTRTGDGYRTNPIGAGTTHAVGSNTPVTFEYKVRKWLQVEDNASTNYINEPTSVISWLNERSLCSVVAPSPSYYDPFGTASVVDLIYEDNVDADPSGILSSTYTGILDICTDGINVYIIDDNGYVIKQPVNGDSSSVLDASHDATLICTNGVEVFYADSSGDIYRKNIASGDPTLFSTGSSNIASMKERGGVLYWADDVSGKILKKSLASGDAVELATGYVDSCQIDVSNDYVYWTRLVSSNNWSILKVAIGGGSVGTVTSTYLDLSTSHSSQIVCDGSYIYFGEGRYIKKIHVSGGDIITIATLDESSARCLYLCTDGLYVYFSVEGTAVDHYIGKVQVEGGSIVEKGGTEPSKIIFDRKYLYYIGYSAPDYTVRYVRPGLERRGIYTREVLASSDKYVFSSCVKGERKYARFGYGTCNNDFDTEIIVNLQEHVVQRISGNIGSYGCNYLGSGWTYVWFINLNNTGINTNILPHLYFSDYLDPTKVAAIPGDPNPDFVWGYNITNGTDYPVSSFDSAGRGECSSLFSAINVPNWLRRDISINFIPEYSSSTITSGINYYIAHFNDATQNIKIYLNGTDKKIYVYGASALVTSSALTWSRLSELKINIYPSEGKIILKNFLTGDGTHTGSSWSTDDGIVYIGCSSTGEQINGYISEPEPISTI